MKDRLIEILEPLGYPIFQQGSMNEDETYPDNFFTFWNNETYEVSFYGNVGTRTIWNFDLNFYSNDPKCLNETVKKVVDMLKDEDFIIVRKGYDIASDEPTHTGRGINISKIEED